MPHISESCEPNDLIRINCYFNHTFLVWANRTWDPDVLSGVGYSPFNIWQNNSVADYYIFRPNKVQAN